MKRELRTLQSQELRVSTAEDGTKTLSAIIPYNSSSVDLGGFTERIAPGAFAAALQPDADVLCLRDHDSSILLGRTRSKTLSLEDSPHGLRYTCTLPDTTQANDLVKSIERGDLDSTSFGFSTIEDSWIEDKSTRQVMRTLMQVELHEVSPCSFPAYPMTSVSVRSCPVELRSKLKIAKRDDEGEDGMDDCDCDCSQCESGACEICSNTECSSEACRCENSSRSKSDAEQVIRSNDQVLLRIKIALGELELSQ